MPIDEEELFRTLLSGHAMKVLDADFEPARAEVIAARLNEGQWRLTVRYARAPA